MTYVESAMEKIAQVSRTDKIIVEKSTVPCGTARYMAEVLSSIGHPGVQFDILSNPEFLAEGTAIENLEYPDRILIGSEPTARGLAARSVLADLYATWVHRDRIIGMNICSAELAKLAANAILAQRISSINALSAICEESGADIEEVAFAVGLDLRIGPNMLKASVGFGGSCLKKDVLHLAHFSDTLLLPEIGNYWKSVNEINEYQKYRFSQRIVTRLHNTLTDKKIAVLGFAFKKNTGDIRESAATAIVARLVAEKAEVAIYDPQVKAENIWSELERETGKTRSTLSTSQAHSVVIATEWEEFSNKVLQTNMYQIVPQLTPDASPKFKNCPLPSTSYQKNVSDESKSQRIDWARVYSGMRYPKIVFDGRNVVDPVKLHNLGFQVECIGKSRRR
jgi:UDPglucose 6-dehydrogenase